MPNSTAHRHKKARRLALLLLLFGIALIPSLSPRAQRSKNSPVNVAKVSTQQTGGQTVVTVSADTPLNRTQTWQDSEGFHLVLPHAGTGRVRGVPRGVKVRQVGDSLEMVVAVKPGSSVTVQPNFNRLNLLVNGGIDTRQNIPDDTAPVPQSRRTQERSAEQYTESSPARVQRERPIITAEAPTVVSTPVRPERNSSEPSASSSSVSITTTTSGTNGAANPGAQPGGSPSASPSASQQPSPAQTGNASQPPVQTLVSQGDGSAAPSPAPSEQSSTAQPAQQSQNTVTTSGGDSVFSYLFSTTGVAIFLVLGLGGLAYMRYRRKAQGEDEAVSKEKKQEKAQPATESLEADATAKVETSGMVERRKEDRRKKARRISDQVIKQPQPNLVLAPEGESHEQALELRPAGAVPSTLFGAYRVDQEVGKLVLGQPHRLDVLLSRASDDRRAMETSLLKIMHSSEVGEDCRRRARGALEEYGFVARWSAALLLAQDAYERASAARTLGEIGSPVALPFLLEALYDVELVVRTHAVTSLGELRIPAAIGALLDMARRYPEMPVELIRRTLSACTFEGITIPGTLALDGEHWHEEPAEEQFTGEITHLDPATTVEQLPEWLEDETLSEALTRLESTDVEARMAAVRQLAQFQVQRSVEALAAIASRDEESSVRAAAVSSLGAINHESVFAPVLIALADEARIVQAAAARALSRLNFDRADAYVRVLETANPETLRQVACSCIKAGMAKQAIDRLASEDRRQAYEAFSLLSLLARSNETQPILEAISSHEDINIRLAATRLLGFEGRPEVATQLRHLIVQDGLPEKVRTALLEVVYKIDQAQPVL